MKFKAVIGILLVAASVAGMWFWESSLRDKLLLDEVIVAPRDIKAGEMITEEDLAASGFFTKNRLKHSLPVDKKEELIGKISLYPVSKNSQIEYCNFVSKEELEADNDRRMILPKEWIFLKNSNLKAKDQVSLYTVPGKLFLGTFIVESVDIQDDRFVEILCSLEEYLFIYDQMTLDSNNRLLIVLEKES